MKIGLGRARGYHVEPAPAMGRAGSTDSHLEPPITLTATQPGRILLLSTENDDEAADGGTDLPQFASSLGGARVHL